MLYWELEDRRYRAPTDNPLAMERWSPALARWVPYLGDSARVLRDAVQVNL